MIQANSSQNCAIPLKILFNSFLFLAGFHCFSSFYAQERIASPCSSLSRSLWELAVDVAIPKNPDIILIRLSATSGHWVYLKADVLFFILFLERRGKEVFVTIDERQAPNHKL